jgi:hypothetical protein
MVNRSRIRLCDLLLVALVLLFCVQTSVAENETDQPSTRKSFSFRGAPQKSVDMFLISEVGVASRYFILQPGFNDHLAGHITWELGLMKNILPKHAVGGTIYASYDDTYEQAILLGLKARYRFWLTERFHLDIGSGMLLSENRPSLFSNRLKQRRIYPSFIGHIGIGVADWVSLRWAVQKVRDTEQHVKDTYYGITVGGPYLGLIAMPISLALIMIAREINN